MNPIDSSPGEPGPRIVRPTQRCLCEDMANEIDAEATRFAHHPTNMAATNAEGSAPFAVTKIRHPMLDKTNDPNAHHERIRSITDRRAVKVKTADRRGMMWQDENDTWWLLACGRRKSDGPGDFYRDLDRFTNTSSEALAPSAYDRKHVAFEREFNAQCERERSTQRAVIGAVIDAATSPGSNISVEAFGAEVTVRTLLDLEQTSETAGRLF